MRSAAIGLILLSIGCNSTTPPGDDGKKPDTDKDDDIVAPAFPEGQGQTKTPQKPYQVGPYGINKGSTIQNFKFQGFHNPGNNASKDAMEGMELADYWNPDGNGVFTEGPFAGQPKPRALLIDVSAVWCSPCQYESRYILPPEHLKLRPRGGEFLLVLGDGGDPGTPPVPQELQNWVTKYKLKFPSVLDPSAKLSALFDQDAFPTNMIIDLKTMKIVEVVAGIPFKCNTDVTPWTNDVNGGYEFWQTFENLLDEATTCAQDFAAEG